MFEALTEGLEKVFTALRRKTYITEANIKDAVKEVRRALLQADVAYRVARDFTEKVKQKALGEQVAKSIEPAHLFLKIVYEELVDLLGGQRPTLNLNGYPAVIMLVGLQGSGKTTTAVKLARHIQQKLNRKAALVAGDVYRAAAVDQLIRLAEKASIPVYTSNSTIPPQIAQEALLWARKNGYDVLLVDTAGRHTLQEEMMSELQEIEKILVPHETLLVVDSTIGQQCLDVINGFSNHIKLTGVILTKVDSDARGGAALTIRYTTGLPIKCVGTGETIDQLEPFDPESIARRILGMGDILAFVEKAQEHIQREEAAKIAEKIRQDSFDFNDLLTQLRQLKKMGNLQELLSLLPGGGKLASKINFDERRLKHMEAIILSMTPEERSNPDIINLSRRERIARGSGRPLQEVNQLIKQLKTMRKLIKKLKNPKALQQLTRQLLGNPLPPTL